MNMAFGPMTILRLVALFPFFNDDAAQHSGAHRTLCPRSLQTRSAAAISEYWLQSWGLWNVLKRARHDSHVKPYSTESGILLPLLFPQLLFWISISAIPLPRRSYRSLTKEQRNIGLIDFSVFGLDLLFGSLHHNGTEAFGLWDRSPIEIWLCGQEPKYCEFEPRFQNTHFGQICFHQRHLAKNRLLWN